MRQQLEARTVAEVVAFLLSDAAAFVVDAQWTVDRGLHDPMTGRAPIPHDEDRKWTRGRIAR